MGSGAGKPVVSPAATPAYTFCYTSSPGEGGGSGSGAAEPSRPSSQQSNYGEPVDANCNMVCEACSASFHLFKKKYRCSDCDKYYCSNCIVKEPKRCCHTCCTISQSPTRAALMMLKIKDLRFYLNTHSVSTQSCTEKDDLVDLILDYVSTHSTNQTDSSRPAQSTSGGTSNNRQSQSSTSTSNNQQQQQQQQQTGSRPGVQQRFEDTFNEIFSRLATNMESSVDPPMFNSPFFGANINVQTGGQTFTSNSAASGSTQRPASRQAWTTSDQSTGTTQEEPQSNSSTQSQPMTEPEQTPVQPVIRRASLSDIQSEEGVESLSVRQLKEILVSNFVDYKGCVERWELQERVKRLFVERQQRKMKEEQPKEASKEGEKVDDDDEADLCKICMDAHIDCVLLECGHMVTCTSCGKRMNECPICRQYVVRAVHIFRA